MFKTTPFKHQLKEFNGHWTDRSRALLWQPRSGKSKVIVDTACALYEAMEIGGVLVIAPNGVHVNWREIEIPTHQWQGGKGRSHTWRFSDPFNQHLFDMFIMDIKKHDDQLSWFMVNMESLARDEVKKAIKLFKKACGRIMVVYDESHHFGRPGSKRTKVARGIARIADYRRILSGTSVENSPLQAWSQFELLEKGALGHERYSDFQEEFAEFELRRGGGRQYRVVSRYVNVDRLKARMSRLSSVVLRSDCEDLPPIQEVIRYVELSDDQRLAWKAIKKKEILNLEALGLFNPLAGGAAFIKLQQVEGGFLKAEQGTQVRSICGWDPDQNPALHSVCEEVEQAGGSSVIVWCQFIHEIEAVFKRLDALGYKVATYHGRVPPKERDEIRRRFRDREIQVLVGQPQAGGEGHNFSAADLIIYMSQTPDAIVREQSSERGTAVGKKSVQIVHLMVKGGINEHFHGITDRKTTLADDISREGLKAMLDRLEV